MLQGSIGAQLTVISDVPTHRSNLVHVEDQEDKRIPTPLPHNHTLQIKPKCGPVLQNNKGYIRLAKTIQPLITFYFSIYFWGSYLLAVPSDI